jgi:hypothetical protein
MRWWKRIVAGVVGWWKGLQPETPAPDHLVVSAKVVQPASTKPEQPKVVPASFAEAYAAACDRVRLSKGDPIPLGLRLTFDATGTKTVVDRAHPGEVVIEGQPPGRPVVSTGPLLYSPWGSDRTQRAVAKSDEKFYAPFSEAELNILMTRAMSQPYVRAMSFNPDQEARVRTALAKAKRPLADEEILAAARE